MQKIVKILLDARIKNNKLAEYHSAETDKMHLVAFKTGGLISAVVYDTNDETFANYTVGNKDRDGAALILALIPVLAEDKEFADNLEFFYEDYQASFGDMKAATEHGYYGKSPPLMRYSQRRT